MYVRVLNLSLSNLRFSLSQGGLPIHYLIFFCYVLKSPIGGGYPFSLLELFCYVLKTPVLFFFGGGYSFSILEFFCYVLKSPIWEGGTYSVL